jgi:hypothetical protein
MKFPQEKQLKQHKQEIKGEHETRVPKGEEHLHFDGDVNKLDGDHCKSTTFPTFTTTFATSTTIDT